MAILKSTATRNPGDPVSTSTSGLGSLLPELFNKAIDEGILTAQNVALGDKTYGGLYAEDPTEEELEAGFLDISQAQGTPTYGIPDFDRYSYASRDFRSLPSLYELYLGGGFPGDTTDTAQIPGAIDTLVNVSGGDQGGGGGGKLDQVTGDSVAGFDAGVIPGPSGFIGLDQDMDIDPQDFAQEDYGIYDPTATPDYSDVTTAVGPPSILNPYEPQTLASPTLTKMDTSEVDIGNFLDSEPEAPTGVMGPVNYMQPKETLASEKLSAPYGVNPDTGIPYETPRTIADQNRVLGQTFAADEVDEQGNLLEKGIQKIQNLMPDFDPAKAAFKLGFNTLIGKPISLVFDLLQAAGLEGGRSDLSDRLEEQYGMDDIGRLTSGPMKNYAVDSFFGDIGESAEERIEDISSVLKNKYNFTDEEIEQAKKGKYTGEKGQLFVGDQDMGKKTNLITDLADLTNFVDEVDYLSGDPKGANTELDIATGNLTGDAAGAEAAQNLNLVDVADKMAGVQTGDASIAEQIAAENRAAAEVAKQEQASKDFGRAFHDGGNKGGTTSSAGGYSRGDYGGRGHHWSKGGIVSLKNAKR